MDDVKDTQAPLEAPKLSAPKPDVPAKVEPEPLNIGELLEDESAADTPVKVADLKKWYEAQRHEIVATVEQDFRKRTEEENARRRASEDQNAAAAADIDWAQHIFERLASPDADERATAEAEMQSNASRYNRGRSLKFERESTEAQNRAVSEYMAPIWKHVQDAGEYTDLIEALKPDGPLMQEAGGNWLLAAMKHAETRGYERGRTEKSEDDDQQRRINDGAGGPPMLGGISRGSGESITDGVQLGAPGSTRLLRERREAAMRRK